MSGATYHKERRRLKRWRKVTIQGYQAVETESKAREWVTLYQHSGVSLQFNPTYYEFRLWLFARGESFGLDLDRAKVDEVIKGLLLSRFLISNVPSHGGAWRAPLRSKYQPRYSKGERAYLTRQINRYIIGIRSRKRLSKAQTAVDV